MSLKRKCRDVCVQRPKDIIRYVNPRTQHATSLPSHRSPLKTQKSASSACQFLNPHCPLLNNSPSNNQKAASPFGHSERNRYFCSEQTVKKTTYEKDFTTYFCSFYLYINKRTNTCEDKRAWNSGSNPFARATRHLLIPQNNRGNKRRGLHPTEKNGGIHHRK